MKQNDMTKQTTAATSGEDFIMKPCVDWCFKELMRNSHTRKGFIAELLELMPDQIGNTTILENELPKRSEEEKRAYWMSMYFWKTELRLILKCRLSTYNTGMTGVCFICVRCLPSNCA